MPGQAIYFRDFSFFNALPAQVFPLPLQPIIFKT